MAYMNDWDDGQLDETLGDIMEEKLEEDAKDTAKDGAKKGGKTALKGADKLTDKISPVKNVKDKVKDKLSNNPIARLRDTIRKAKKKVKDGAKKLAKDGIKAVGRAIAHAMKGIMTWIVAHPIPSLVIFIVLIIIFNTVDIGSDDSESETNASNSYSMTDSSLNDNGELSDDNVVVILMEDCASQAAVEAEDGELSSDKEELAKSIYNVFHSYGFTNASIAGILGNLDKESGLDPSKIECFYEEYGVIGPKKKKIIQSMSNYTKNTVFPKYAASGISLNHDAYKAADGSYYCGMGLVQWTGPGTYNFLSAAETVKAKWYTMEFQLAYMLSDTLYRKGFFAGWVRNQEPNDDVAAARASGLKFAHDYEGNHSFDAQREDAAETWFNKITGWENTVDQGYVDSIVDMATQLGGIVEFEAVAKKSERCGTQSDKYDNSSLAKAAVSYAWPTKGESYNNGTNLYQVVIPGCFNGDTYFKACDRTVAGAVRWSGTDDNYPLCTSTQLNYLASSPKWELVGSADKLKEEDLQPGDVFILDGHTLMYVGEEAVQEVHSDKAEAGSNSVSASLDERSASCNADVTHILSSGGGDHRGKYQVYRCIQPDNSDTYKSVGSTTK